MRVATHLTGVTPLLMHNVRLSDPDHPLTQRIAELTSKKKDMTAEDRARKAELEWYGGLYFRDVGEHKEPIVPTANLRKCFKEAAKITRSSKFIDRALFPAELEATLVHDGPRYADEIYKLPRFVFTTMVGIQRRKIQRTRPIFTRWELLSEFELLTDILDFEKFVTIANTAGRAEGLGDNRVNGYGRFTAEVKKV